VILVLQELFKIFIVLGPAPIYRDVYFIANVTILFLSSQDVLQVVFFWVLRPPFLAFIQLLDVIYAPMHYNRKGKRGKSKHNILILICILELGPNYFGRDWPSMSHLKSMIY
jgi:hypothetical protein